MSLIVTPGKLVQRAELYHQLASLMAAGVDVIHALDLIRRRPPSILYRRPLADISARIRAGATLAESLLRLGAWVPTFDLALIQAAEQSGRLPECFRLLADYYNERAQLVRSEEHTSELQSRLHLVCRLLLEKKKKIRIYAAHSRNLTQISQT